MAEDQKSKLLDKIDRMVQSSTNMRSTYEQRWAKNLKLKFGIFSETKSNRSKVRNQDKIFFRKIWATEWRLLASFYNSFLRDPDSYKIEGRDRLRDWYQAMILHEMVEYRRDKMMRLNSLFLKHIWAFQDIMDHGYCAGKMRWVYNENTGEDGPDYILYPPEQVYLDLRAETEDKMRFVIFENYMTKEEMEENKYENIEEAQPSSVPYNQVRAVRHNIHKDPLTNYSENEYPAPGAFGEGTKSDSQKIYVVWECFYREDNEIKFMVTNETNCVLQKPEPSPYGNKRFPAVFGQCLTVAHRLIGEGFAEPLEGPQESYNYNLNMRKDNVALALNKHSIVSRYGGVDLQSLINSRAGGVTLVDDVNAIKEREVGDVTQSSYLEASADDMMMQEMSGINDAKQGREKAEKATVAQINYAEANAKIDLFIAIVAETYWKSFHSLLATLIQRFETDETIFRIANNKARELTQNIFRPNEYDIDFDADCSVKVGVGTMGREFEIKETMLAIDRAVMANQSQFQMVQAGVVNPQHVTFINISALMDDLFPKLGKKSTERYYIPAQPPPQPEAEGGQDRALAGRIQPQIGNQQVSKDQPIMLPQGNI